MAQAAKQRKLKALFDASMAKGGLPEFKKNWEQSIGLHEVETRYEREDGSHGIRTQKKFHPDKREVDYREFHIGAICDSLMGEDWRQTFEQHWVRASAARFEGVGNAVMPGEIAYVSAAIDVIAGLANARAMERPAAAEFIWDKVCEPVEIVGEGGYDIIVRSAGMPTAIDLADGQALPTVKLQPMRVHRNRSLNQGLRTKINKYTILDDLTGTLYEAVDENSAAVLLERERKVADCLLGVSSGTTLATAQTIGQVGLAIPISQDGLVWFPWQKGIWNANAGAPAGVQISSPQNQQDVRNYGNCNDSDGLGLTDYTMISRALTILAANRDPFTNLPIPAPLDGMTILCPPRSRPQLEVILQGRDIWQVANGGLTNAVGSNTVSPYNFAKEKNLQVVESQVFFNRLVDVGLMLQSATGVISQHTFTNAAADTYNTAWSIASVLYMGHFKKAIKYVQRNPFNVVQVPLGSQEYAEETVLVQDVRERGQAYWRDPRQVWRAFA
jgi:hypothetical protein